MSGGSGVPSDGPAGQVVCLEDPTAWLREHPLTSTTCTSNKDDGIGLQIVEAKGGEGAPARTPSPYLSTPTSTAHLSTTPYVCHMVAFL